MKGQIKAVAIVVVGVIVAGLVLRYADDLPVISDAKKGLS